MKSAAKEKILHLVQALPGKVSIWARQPASGEEISFQPDLPHVAASIIKIPLMAEAFHRREIGEMNFQEEFILRDEDKMPSCGALNRLHSGLRLTAEDLINLMIILSDNTATNLLFDRLGLENVNLEMARLGLSGLSRCRRKLFDAELSRQGIENEVTARDMGSLLESMLKEELISPAASREMLDILLSQRLNGKMPFYLHSHGIRCAHKTGEDDGITHDVGIILTEKPWVFCFLSSETDVPAAERVIQETAALLSGLPS